MIAGKRFVAAEDVGGTDDLLARVARHRREGRIGDGAGALVLAKAAKPQQPMFVDLPAIGPHTVSAAADAGKRHPGGRRSQCAAKANRRAKWRQLPACN